MSPGIYGGMGRLPLEDLPTDRRFMYSVCLSLVLLGLVAFGYGLLGWANTFEVRHWQRVRGEVLSAESERVRVRSKKHEHEYHLYVHYTYKVDGQSHHGARIDAASEFVTPPQEQPYHVLSDRDEVDELLQRYRPGREVDVFYNPEDPGQALLTKGLRYWHEIALWMGLPIAVLGFLLFRWLRRTEPPDDEGAAKPADTINAD